MVKLIVACSKNLVIGNKGKIPWHLPNDFKYFKEMTLNSYILMGRKTFESLPNVLPNRKHIILTSNKNYTINNENCIVVNTIDDVFNISNDFWVIGGSEIYKLMHKYVDEMYITIVDTEIEGDSKFISFDLNDWILKKEDYHQKDDSHKYNYSFLIFKRK